MDDQINEYIFIINKIDRVINQDKEVAIFPFGEKGKIVYDVLDKYYLKKPLFIIDNELSKNDKDIKDISILNSVNHSNLCILYCCSNKELKVELRKLLRIYVDDKKVIDVFRGHPRFHFNTTKIHELINARIINRHHYLHFLHTLSCKKINVLDVGCGNRSAEIIKGIRPNIYYTGIDVGNYNQTKNSIIKMDNYIIVHPDDFDEAIMRFHGTQDVVISNHNIEHTNKPDKCVRAMALALKPGGRLFMAFPSRMSVFFPSRGGTLNFYDDPTHVNLMNFKNICKILRNNGIRITFATSCMHGKFLRKLGEYEEGLSNDLDRVLCGTWDYWGFEAIIWGKRK